MKKGFGISFLFAAIAVILIAAANGIVVDVWKFPDAPYFQQLDTRKLFQSGYAVSDSVILQAVAAQSNANYKASRVKVNKVGRDTLFSNIFPIVSGYTTIYGSADSLAGDSVPAKLYLGLYRGLAFGDSLGFEWYLLETFSGDGGLDTFMYVLKDSAWFADRASPYAVLKVEEGDSCIIGWYFDIFGYEGRGR